MILGCILKANKPLGYQVAKVSSASTYNISGLCNYTKRI